MTEQPPVKVGLGRSNAVVTLALLLFLGGLTGVAAYGGLRASGSARVLGLGIALIFAVPLVMLLRALPKFLSPRYVVVDAEGLHILHGKERVSLPWPEVVAVAIGYERAPDEPYSPPRSLEAVQDDAAKDRLAQQVQEALHVSGRRRLALEIFPARADALDRVPRLKPYGKRLPPPVAGLPEVRWSFILPPVVEIAERIAGAVRVSQPNRWLGWIVRPFGGAAS
jgi:hypothetical protein